MERAVPERHHLLYDKVVWGSQEYGRKLRTCYWLIPLLHPTIHQTIHESLASVPLPDRYAQRNIWMGFEPVENDYLGSIDNLLFSIEAANKHPRTSRLDKQLTYLAMCAIELQKPLVKEGLIKVV